MRVLAAGRGGQLPFGLSECGVSIVFVAECVCRLLVRDACGCRRLPVCLSKVVVCRCGLISIAATIVKLLVSIAGCHWVVPQVSRIAVGVFVQ